MIVDRPTTDINLFDLGRDCGCPTSAHCVLPDVAAIHPSVGFIPVPRLRLSLSEDPEIRGRRNR